MFDPLDLAGELYRMNLSCSDGVESGCLFFKVLGTANITDGQQSISTLPTIPQCHD